MDPSKQKRAFTLPEMLIVICIVVVVVFVVIVPAGGPVRPHAHRIKCINNLKNVALAQRIFLTDNPSAVLGTNSSTLTAADYFRSLSNELSTPHILTCPTDRRANEAPDFATLSNRNVSYFVNPLAGPSDTNGSAAFLSGDRNLETNGIPVPSGSMLKVIGTLDLGWTKEMHNHDGNIAMNDGSVQQFDSKRLRTFQATSASTNLLLIP